MSTYSLAGMNTTGPRGGLSEMLRPEPDYAHWDALQAGAPLDAPEAIPRGALRTFESISVPGRFYVSDSLWVR